MNDVPVIDLGARCDSATLRRLDEACREWGFFQVTRHGVDDVVLSGIDRAMRDFFAQPMAAKRSLERTATNPWGFYDRELTKNTRDWKQIWDVGPADGAIVPQWPAGLPGFREAVRAYYSGCERLAFRLLAALSVNLGMSPGHLAECFRPAHTSFVRFNYYPVCPVPERPEGLQLAKSGHLGLNHHTDAGALTVLLQDDEPGLEVYHDGAWCLVEPRRDALVINVGDVVQVWSNDGYRAPVHRVIASPRAERYSAPFFMNPAYSACYAPLPATVDGTHPARYREINWGEFRARRATGDYADQGEEIQISDYRVAAGMTARRNGAREVKEGAHE
jgi:isopenicillin N synthase-like dioxygenase